jgi:hypothetical protein
MSVFCVFRHFYDEKNSLFYEGISAFYERNSRFYERILIFGLEGFLAGEANL